jgi:hypothetical protein
MRHLGLSILALFAICIAMAAQSPTFKQSTAANCSPGSGYAGGNVCNGLPLDGGGDWQFIEVNQAFSIYSTEGSGFYIFGNPGNPGTGGLTVTSDTIPAPPYCTYKHSCPGAEGEIDLTWAAEDPNTSVHYTGSAKVFGHYVRSCPFRCSSTLRVDAADIFVDQPIN